MDNLLSNGAYFLTWNPKRWPWSAMKKERQALESNMIVRRWWSTGNRSSIPLGARLYVLKLGEHPKGIVASGVAAHEVIRREHFDPQRRAAGDRVKSTLIQFDRILPAETPVPFPEQGNAGLADIDWSPQASGVRIVDLAAHHLEKYWIRALGHDRPKTAFLPGARYSRFDVLSLLGLEPKRGGAPFTGYFQHEGNFLIFATLGDVAGATGHNYPNEWVGEYLRWYTKGNATLSSPSIQAMLSPRSNIHVFTRRELRSRFRYEGLAHAARYEGSAPVCIHWAFEETQQAIERSLGADESSLSFREGALKRVAVNVRERDPAARAACIERYGLACCVCGMVFEEVYGDIGRGYIHVHHLQPLGEGEDSGTATNPAEDLRPVCPNCHAMLHRQSPPLSPTELIERMSNYNA